MIETDTELRAADVAQTDGNLRLVSRFIRAFLDDPERFAPVPEGAATVLLPPAGQDRELAEANLRMAKRLKAEGRDVILWTVNRA